MTTSSPQARSQPRLARRYVLAAALFTIGVILGPGVLVATVLLGLESTSGGEQFAAPGTTTFHADKAGPFLIWDQTRGAHNSDDAWDAFSKLAVSIVSEVDHKSIPVFEDRTTTSQVGSVHRRSAFAFKAPAAGDYRITVSGSVPAREFVVAPSPFPSTFLIIAGVACSGFVGFALVIAAMVVLVLTIVAHVRARTVQPASPT